VIGCSSGKVKLEGLDDEILAFWVSIKQTLTVDPLYQIFSENNFKIANKI
jgi:hypothetical protein